MTRRCFILGAGFSKACGLPLAKELTAAVWGHLSQNKKSAALGFPLDKWQDVLKRSYPCCDCVNQWPDFEDLITLLEERAKLLNQCAGSGSAGGPVRPHLKDVLLRHMALKLFEMCIDMDHRGNESLSKFVKMIDYEQDSIISFNWDLLLEMACHRAKIEVTYQDQKPRAIQLIKPHGSINLVNVDPRNHEGFCFEDVVHGLAKEGPCDGGNVYRAADPSSTQTTVIEKFGKADKFGLLVEPTAMKEYGCPWIWKQWRLAWKKLREAQEVIIIGFSLPQSDYRPRVLLQMLSAQCARDPPGVLLVDPYAHCVIAKRYAPYVGLHIKPIAKGWEEWLSEIT